MRRLSFCAVLLMTASFAPHVMAQSGSSSSTSSSSSSTTTTTTNNSTTTTTNNGGVVPANGYDPSTLWSNMTPQQRRAAIEQQDRAYLAMTPAQRAAAEAKFNARYGALPESQQAALRERFGNNYDRYDRIYNNGRTEGPDGREWHNRDAWNDPSDYRRNRRDGAGTDRDHASPRDWRHDARNARGNTPFSGPSYQGRYYDGRPYTR